MINSKPQSHHKSTLAVIFTIAIFLMQTAMAKSVPPYKEGFAPEKEVHQLIVLLDKNNADTEKFVTNYKETRNKKQEILF